MKKRIFVLLILAAFITTGVFAQARQTTPAPAAAPAAAEVKSAFYFDAFPLVKGLVASGDYSADVSAFVLAISGGYERSIASHFSICAGGDLYIGNVDFGFYDVDVVYFAATAQFRWYLMSEDFSKLFVGADIGINVFSYDDETKAEDGGFFGLIGAVKIGYKIQGKGKMYFEPSMSYVLSKVSTMEDSLGATFPTPRGWQGGFRVGWAL